MCAIVYCTSTNTVNSEDDISVTETERYHSVTTDRNGKILSEGFNEITGDIEKHYAITNTSFDMKNRKIQMYKTYSDGSSYYEIYDTTGSIIQTGKTERISITITIK